MKKFALFLFTCAILCACEDPYSEHVTPGGGSSSEVIVPKANFTYSTSDGVLTLTIKDKSTGTHVKYDMGDGSVYSRVETGETITHKYKSAGTYIIKAWAYGRNANGYITSDEKHVQVTVSNPSSIYCRGIVYYIIPYQDKYYYFKLKDDGPWIVKTWVNAGYTNLLYNSVLPYQYIFKEAVLLENVSKHDYYTLYVYYNSKQSGDGTQCLKQNINTSAILKYPEYIEVQNDAKTMKVRLYFGYK